MASHLPILAAEDEETDALLLRMAHKRAGLANPLVIARDGQMAVDYLAGAPPYQDRCAHPLPCLLLLDLKMPRMSGFEVLEWLANRPELRHLPAVVLSSSSDQADIEQARRMGARAYLVKPHDFRKLTGLVQELAHRWLVDAKDAI
jgi:CheY-like chemotaxis protein